MFFLKGLSLELTLHPSYFGPLMHQYLREKLLQEVEGTVSGEYGYIVSVVDGMEINVGSGVVQSGQGSATFNVKYHAIVFKPFKGEVVDAIVTNVNKMGVFCDVGPLSVFVSAHLIPQNMSFNPATNPPAFVSEDQSIEKGSKIRVKIVGVRADVGKIFAIGSIKEDFLGLL
ncbi:DNA-directed RNA polymerase II subunit [Starmerella bacillaris]|uniref:DNA-directed RNA polymerase subunit n=1 Tax=Starmerella bacillaris TaxID=1247836 RepID=A0AAV5RGD4_STABA|nr:DNA-directed RNA polymerase II subunit [Starmerella bacillaris]